MKPNVKLNSKAKNSFVYFQLGLIITMVLALFVLEFNFKTIKITPKSDNAKLYVEPPFQYNPVVLVNKSIAESKPIQKAVKLTNVIKTVANNQVVKPLTDVTPVIDNTAVDNTENVTNNNTVNNTPTITKSEHTVFSVEQLPMFDACKGVRREEQKECFDSELRKFISKNVSYPSNDLEKGKEGTALIEFVINERGEITNVKALDNKRASIDMQKAAEKAIKKLPRIIPAKQGDENVRIKYLIPVSFKLK
jgi:periplasmic protein TonB